MKSMWMNFWQGDDSGQGLVEYALLVGLVAVLLVATLVAFREQITAVFTGATTELGKAVPAAGTSG